MTPGRIVSLVPDASAWLALLGMQDRLVAGTPACPARSGRPDLPVCTRPGYAVAAARALLPSDPVPRNPEVDLDRELLRDLAPDLVIVDRWNEAWPDGAAMWAPDGGDPVEVWPWNVRTLRDALEQGLRLGRRLGAMDRAMKELGDREAELLAWRRRTGLHRRAPDGMLDPVLVVTSLDPPAAAAGWTAEVVDRAAARLVTGRSGEPAAALTADALPVDPETIVVIALPGRSALEAAAAVDASPGLAAVLARARRVVCYDPGGTLDGAGPGLHDAILDLMAIVHRLEGRALDGRTVSWSGTADRK